MRHWFHVKLVEDAVTLYFQYGEIFSFARFHVESKLMKFIAG